MTLGEAMLDLQRQAYARGFSGFIDDVEVFRCEDGSWSLWAYAGLDQPLTANFVLPEHEGDELIEHIRAKFARRRGGTLK